MYKFKVTFFILDLCQLNITMACYIKVNLFTIITCVYYELFLASYLFIYLFISEGRNIEQIR
jgi:hypothetical protein